MKPIQTLPTHDCTCNRRATSLATTLAELCNPLLIRKNLYIRHCFQFLLKLLEHLDRIFRVALLCFMCCKQALPRVFKNLSPTGRWLCINGCNQLLVNTAIEVADGIGGHHTFETTAPVIEVVPVQPRFPRTVEESLVKAIQIWQPNVMLIDNLSNTSKPPRKLLPIIRKPPRALRQERHWVGQV